jgi:hypothetical protein
MKGVRKALEYLTQVFARYAEDVDRILATDVHPLVAWEDIEQR